MAVSGPRQHVIYTDTPADNIPIIVASSLPLCPRGTIINLKLGKIIVAAHVNTRDTALYALRLKCASANRPPPLVRAEKAVVWHDTVSVGLLRGTLDIRDVPMVTPKVVNLNHVSLSDHARNSANISNGTKSAAKAKADGGVS